MRRWQVLGSNQRRLSRRFYSTILPFEQHAADQRLRDLRPQAAPPPSAICPCPRVRAAHRTDAPDRAILFANPLTQAGLLRRTTRSATAAIAPSAGRSAWSWASSPTRTCTSPATDLGPLARSRPSPAEVSPLESHLPGRCQMRSMISLASLRLRSWRSSR
jgi:hypothetical protein